MNDELSLLLFEIVRFLFIVMPMALLFLLSYIRYKDNSFVIMAIKTFTIILYSFMTSLIVYHIGEMLGYSNKILWISISMAALLGMEIHFWHFTKLASRGNMLAKKVLEI